VIEAQQTLTAYSAKTLVVDAASGGAGPKFTGCLLARHGPDRACSVSKVRVLPVRPRCRAVDREEAVMPRPTNFGERTSTRGGWAVCDNAATLRYF
jgi:hypothetical protein